MNAWIYWLIALGVLLELSEQHMNIGLALLQSLIWPLWIGRELATRFLLP